MKNDEDSWKLYQAVNEACKNGLPLTIETDTCTYTFKDLVQLSCEAGENPGEVIINQEAEYYVTFK